MKKIISLYKRVMNWLENHRILKYFVVPGLFTKRWYKTWIYKLLAAPVGMIKRRNILSHLPFGEFSVAVMLALLGTIPPPLWRDWFVFVVFWTLAVMFILKTANVRAAADCSIYLYIFIAAAFFLPTSVPAALMLLYLFAIAGISFIIMHVIDSPRDIYKILFGTYIAVVARSLYVAADTFLSANLQSGVDFGEFLVMLFPFALAFTFLKANSKRRGWLIVGLLPSVYGVLAAIFDIGDILQRQIREIPMDGDFMTYAMMAQDIYARAGTVGTQPFIDIYSAFMGAIGSQNLWARLLLYLGMLGILLFLWYVIRLVRRAVVRVFKKKGDARIALIAGIFALLGVVIMIPFEMSHLSVRTLFMYWVIIGIVGGVVKNKLGAQ